MPDPLREQKSLPTNDVRVRYHGFSIFMHWLMALLIFALFAAGYWMVDLTYYSAWYKTAPQHRRKGRAPAVQRGDIRYRPYASSLETEIRRR